MTKSFGVRTGSLLPYKSCSIIGIPHCEWWLNDALACWRRGSRSWLECTRSLSLDNDWLWLLVVHCITLSACITGRMKCSMCGKDHLCVTVTQTQRELHEGSGGTEEAFTSRAQQAIIISHCLEIKKECISVKIGNLAFNTPKHRSITIRNEECL